MKAFRVAVLVGVALAALPALAQPVIDYSISLLQGGVATPGGDTTIAILIQPDWFSIDNKDPFVARLTVPAGMEPAATCSDGETSFDATTRVLTWAGRINPNVPVQSCAMPFHVSPAVAPGTTLEFRVTLTMERADPIPANDTASRTIVVLAAADLEVTGSADVQRYRPGTTVTHTFTVVNHGPLDASNVIVEDRLSPHVTFVSFEQLSGPEAVYDTLPGGPSIRLRIPTLANGGTATFRLVVKATPSTEVADIDNRVKVSSTAVDFAERNNELVVWTFAGPEADLSVTTFRRSVSSEHRVPIRIEVVNHGPDTVHEVKLENVLRGQANDYAFVDFVKYGSVTTTRGMCSAPEPTSIFAELPLPLFWSLTCNLGALDAGARATVTIVIERAAGSGAFVHEARVTPAQNDANASNNGSTVEVANRRRAVRR